MNPLAELLGESPGIVAVREKTARLLQRQPDSRRLPPILILGETGTGKGLLARAIHGAGPRAGSPFVDVNCAAIPETLLEAELFGFERGAFTDARQAKPGLFQVAHRGTIFLDEVGLLPEVLQAKLLKTIEEQAVRRLGSTRSEPADVWILSATSENLTQAARQRRFREDLYHRLAVLTVQLPPLRERGEDILRLAEHFLERACADYRLPAKRLDEGARRALSGYHWPGNVRELGNLMERVALLSEGPAVTAGVLGLPSAAAPEARGADLREGPLPLQDAVGSVEQEHLVRALQQTNWNISRAAALLRISRNTLRYRIEKHGLRAGGSPAPAPPRRRAGPPRVPTADVPPAAAESVSAFAGIRWERRRLTLLRVALLDPQGESSQFESSRRLEVLRDKVESFGGRLEELSPTGLVAAFGHEPVEDAPNRAVHAAMAVQKAAERVRRDEASPVEVNVSIHTGQFLVGQAGGTVTIDLEGKRQAWETLDTLVTAAEPGTTLVSAATAAFLERRFDLTPVSGLAEIGERAYRLVGREGSGLGLRGRIAKFVGRQNELELLRSRLAATMRGQGQVVGIAGEAGMGKSRLLHEFRQTLTAEPVVYREGHCVSYGSAIPYLPVLEVVRMTCGLSETDSPEVVTAKVHRTLDELGLNTTEASPYLLLLLGIKEGTEATVILSPEVIQARTFEVLRNMNLQGARRHPLVLVIENLHWVDRTSETFLASLVESVAGAPILLLLTYRPGYRPPWMEKSYATQVALPPLSPEDSLALIHSILRGEPIPPSLAQAIVAKAEGNPFALEELVRAVLERGEIGPTLEVPDTIQEVLLVRINRLPEAAKRLLQTASVLGRQVPRRLLKAIWEGPEDPEPHLRELERLEFLYEQSGGEDPSYLFKHALVREVAYGSLLLSHRQPLHAAAGRALEAAYAERLEEIYGPLAYHYSKTQETLKAVEFLERFARKAAVGHSHVEAVAALGEALAHAERLPREHRDRRIIELALRLAYSLYSLGRFRESVELLLRQRTRVEQLQDPWVAGRYYFRLGLTYSLMGNQKESAEHVQRALEEATRSDDKATMGRAHYELARESFWSGRPLRGLDHGRSAVALLGQTEERRWLGMAHWVVGANSAVMGEFESALEALAQARSIGEAIGDAQLESMAGWTIGGVYATLGEWEAGLLACRRALERSPDPLFRTQAIGWLGYAHLENEDPGPAMTLLDQAVQQLTRFRFRQLQGWFTAWLSQAFVLDGQIERARELVNQALDLTRGVQDWYGVGVAQRVLGRTAQAQGDLLGAEVRFREALETFASADARFEAGRTHLELASLAFHQGNREALTAHLLESYRIFQALRVRKYIERTEQVARSWDVSLLGDRGDPR